MRTATDETEDTMAPITMSGRTHHACCPEEDGPGGECSNAPIMKTSPWAKLIAYDP